MRSCRGETLCPPLRDHARFPDASNLREARFTHRWLQAEEVGERLVEDGVVVAEYGDVPGGIDELKPIRVALPKRGRVEHAEPLLAGIRIFVGRALDHP